MQLIPHGNQSVTHIVVGHNVSYDRAHISEEYSLAGSHTHFLYMMVLHVAIKGISSHQHPMWIKHRKSKLPISFKLSKHNRYLPYLHSLWCLCHVQVHQSRYLLCIIDVQSHKLAIASMVLSAHDPLLAHHLLHTSCHMAHIPARPTSLSLALHPLYLSSSAFQ